MAALTAQQIADGTNQDRRRVERAIGNLQRYHIVSGLLLSADNRKAYGVNTSIEEWGNGTPAWNALVPHIKDARERKLYTHPAVDLYTQNGIPLHTGVPTSTATGGDSGAFSPTASGANGPLQRVLQQERQGFTKEAAPPDSLGMRRPDASMLLQNNPILATAVRDVYGEAWSQAKQNDFVADAGFALREPGCTTTEEEAADAIRHDRKPIPDQRGDWWIGDLCKSKAKQKKPSGPRRLTVDEKRQAEEETFRVRAAAKAEEKRKLEEASGG